MVIQVPEHNSERLGSELYIDTRFHYPETNEMYEQYLNVLVDVPNVSMGEFTTLKSCMSAHDKYIDLSNLVQFGGDTHYFKGALEFPKFAPHVEMATWHNVYTKLLRTLAVLTSSRNVSKTQQLSHTKTSIDIDKSRQMVLVLETKNELLKKEIENTPGGSSLPSHFSASEWNNL